MIYISSVAIALSLVAAGHRVRVESVHDGDTVTVRFADGHAEHVRLLGIDAPELSQGMWGRAAQVMLSGEVLGKTVILETEPVKPDPYGRTLGYLRTRRGMTVNEQMLTDGAAFYYDPGKPLMLTPALLQAEEHARDHRLGVWSAAGLERPWDHRHRRRVVRASPQVRFPQCPRG